MHAPRKSKIWVAVLAALATGTVQAQKTGIFPGRLPGNISLPPSTPTLASPWQQATIGGATAGNATSSSSILTISCYGNPSFTADTGHFVYQALSGDWDMVGQLQSITSDELWSRYVPVVRESTAAGARYFGIFFDHRNKYGTNWRLTTDGMNDWVGFDSDYTAPQWWKISRTGNAFSSYLGSSSTGPWTLNGSQSVTMSDPVDWGILCGNGLNANAAIEVSTLPSIQAGSGGGSAGSVSISVSPTSVNENGSAVTVSIARTGGTTGSGSVVVSRNASSTATVGTDYSVSCTLPCTENWTNGDGATKTFTVTPINRAGSQASRTLILDLGSASTVSIGSPSSATLTINDVSAGGQTKLRAGYYTDCYIWMPHGGDFNHYIGSDGYSAFRACVDWSAQQTGVKGVFIPVMWGSLEGDTAGSYDGTVGNGLAGAGKIGFPLIHDMVNYAKSKHLTVLLEWDWFNYYNDADCTSTATETSQAAYTILGTVPKYLLPPSCGGTDATNYYSGAIYQNPPYLDTYYLKLWKPNVMDRWVALLNAYAAEFDNDIGFEGWILFGEEGDSIISPQDGSVDGYTFATLDGQFQRIVSEVKPNWPHTDIILALAWSRGSQSIVEEAHTSPTKAVSVESNNTVLQQTDYIQCAYLGIVCGANTGTHNYQGELGYTIWQATPDEIGCTAYTHWGYNTPTEIYDGLMTTGFWNGGTPNGRPLKPNRWILNDYQAGLNYCPSEPQANWGTIGGSGWYNFIQSHPINTTCPSDWTGGCNTTTP